MALADALMPCPVQHTAAKITMGKDCTIKSLSLIHISVKQSVSTREAAEFYGIRVRRNGMACCPFHDDKNPSMKVDQRFHCFGCGEDGDVIDFTAKLFEMCIRDRRGGAGGRDYQFGCVH